MALIEDGDLVLFGPPLPRPWQFRHTGPVILVFDAQGNPIGEFSGPDAPDNTHFLTQTFEAWETAQGSPASDPGAQFPSFPGGIPGFGPAEYVEYCRANTLSAKITAHQPSQGCGPVPGR